MMDSRQIVVFIYATWLGDLESVFSKEAFFLEIGLEKFGAKY